MERRTRGLYLRYEGLIAGSSSQSSCACELYHSLRASGHYLTRLSANHSWIAIGGGDPTMDADSTLVLVRQLRGVCVLGIMSSGHIPLSTGKGLGANQCSGVTIALPGRAQRRAGWRGWTDGLRPKATYRMESFLLCSQIYWTDARKTLQREKMMCV